MMDVILASLLLKCSMLPFFSDIIILLDLSFEFDFEQTPELSFLNLLPFCILVYRSYRYCFETENTGAICEAIPPQTKVHKTQIYSGNIIIYLEKMSKMQQFAISTQYIDIFMGAPFWKSIKL